MPKSCSRCSLLLESATLKNLKNINYVNILFVGRQEEGGHVSKTWTKVTGYSEVVTK